MNYIAETGAAAMITGYCVALFKLYKPDAKSSTLVIVSVLSGIVASILVSVSNAGTYTIQDVSQWLIKGILAAAGAAGLTRTDGRAETARSDAQGE